MSIKMPAADARVSFASLTANNLGTVKKLTRCLFPIRYSDKFYSDILSPEVEDFCKLVYYGDIPVGIVCCRLETDKENRISLHLMTIGVLAPYRGRGIGTQTLNLVLHAADSRASPRIHNIFLHVQTSNLPAKRFYERNGFNQTGINENYYKKIVPHDAWVLERFAAEITNGK